MTTNMTHSFDPQLSKQLGLDRLRVAIVQYWLLGFAGGERNLDAIIQLFPQADIFTLMADDEAFERWRSHKITTSFLQRFSVAKRHHRHTLPFAPYALEQFDLRDYDLVISSESGPSKGVITPPSACHICYCNSPMRYIWEMYPQYVATMGLLARTIYKPVAHYMRMWDLATASRVDHFIANSDNVARRIRKHYRRDSTVIYPAVDVSSAYISDAIDDYFLVVGRLVDYKRVDLAIAACNQLGLKLHIVGGHERYQAEYQRLRKIAGPTVQFLGNLSQKELHEQYAHCRALIFPAEEDFGIVPVEAQAFGRPVLAFGRGGALETVRSHTPAADGSGLFFHEQSVEALVECLHRFFAVESTFDSERIAAGTERFSIPNFSRQILSYVAERVNPASADVQALVET